MGGALVDVTALSVARGTETAVTVRDFNKHCVYLLHMYGVLQIKEARWWIGRLG